jgi:hypothetical protein
MIFNFLLYLATHSDPTSLLIMICIAILNAVSQNIYFLQLYCTPITSFFSVNIYLQLFLLSAIHDEATQHFQFRNTGSKHDDSIFATTQYCVPKKKGWSEQNRLAENWVQRCHLTYLIGFRTDFFFKTTIAMRKKQAMMRKNVVISCSTDSSKILLREQTLIHFSSIKNNCWPEKAWHLINNIWLTSPQPNWSLNIMYATVGCRYSLKQPHSTVNDKCLLLLERVACLNNTVGDFLHSGLAGAGDAGDVATLKRAICPAAWWLRASERPGEAKRGAYPKNTSENSQGSGEPGWLAGDLPLVPLGGQLAGGARCVRWQSRQSTVRVLADVRMYVCKGWAINRPPHCDLQWSIVLPL